MALMTSLVALSIDAMLPALGAIARDLGVHDPNDRQLVLSALFGGMVIGQLIYGPVSDTVGRKRPIAVGSAIFIFGCVISATANTFEMMLAGRFVQGLGVAGPRIVVTAIIRDQFQGAAMARVMSLIMTVFILVPALAPIIGQGILLFASWRGIFVMFLVLAATGLVWFWVGQAETHPPEKRRALRLGNLLSATWEVLTHPVSLGYTLMASLVFASFLGFLNSAQQILAELYGLDELFPLAFACLALSIGGSTLTNVRLLRHFSMQRLCRGSLTIVVPLSIVFSLIAMALDGVPPLWSLMAYMITLFYCIGLLFGNMNALAMEPMGHIAGLASAVIASISTGVSLVLGGLIGALFNETVLPLVFGFAIFTSGAAVVMYWTERARPAPN
jgi:MFS transporter, DHA1 family, multidrug resistance protein